MPYYAIQIPEMARIMELLFQVLDIRITLFDLHESELDVFRIKELSSFCRTMRQDQEFNRQCVACDKLHLAEARQRREVCIYHCHAGLLEGIVPLYNQRGVYLGAIVFGQLTEDQSLHPGVPPGNFEKMAAIGSLLQYLSKYICENELIRQCVKPWSVRLDEYIDHHLAEKITLGDIARLLGKSVSSLSHGIPQEFGMTLKAYIRKKKMAKARELLRSGSQVRECAFQLGYTDEFYFSRDFKRCFGYPPKKIRVLSDGGEKMYAIDPV